MEININIFIRLALDGLIWNKEALIDYANFFEIIPQDADNYVIDVNLNANIFLGNAIRSFCWILFVIIYLIKSLLIF